MANPERVVPEVLDRLHHRGPDARGHQLWPGAALLHTRLSIIDRSEAGAQPMTNEDGSVWVVFNGEIYNHRALQRELEARGHRFQGYSDTEVIPHLYEEEGPAFVERLRGMFTLALYDSRRKRLILARDRFGIKPLFYAPEADVFAFASEIHALLAVPGLDAAPDRQAIHDYAALLYVPAPATFYAGIRAVEPATWIEVRQEAGGLVQRTHRYHRWVIAPDASLTLHDAAEQAEACVARAVETQLESDVPLGALLSGGIDSSLVSVFAQQGVSGDLRTFNVRFSEGDYDETWAAQAVAAHIGSAHTTLGMDRAGGTWDAVVGLLQHAGQPFADTSLFAVDAVCRLMRRHVTVALSGDGGDEGFGGYNSFWQLGLIERAQRLPALLWGMGQRIAGPLARLGLVRSSLPQRLRDLRQADDAAVLHVLYAWLREEEHARLCRPASTLPVRRLFERQWSHTMPAKASRLEHLSALATEVNLRLRLPNDFLFKVDTASMRHGLEVRVPLLDEDLVAFGLRLPHRLKARSRTTKIVLREVAARRLPEAVARKAKQGFSLPFDTWLDDAFKTRLAETLLDPSCLLSEYFYPVVYRPWVEAFSRGAAVPGVSRAGLYQRVIMLLSLHLALSTHTRSQGTRNAYAH